MNHKHILISGGAGFVGSNLGILFKQDFQDIRVTALDNLKRRGSELSLNRLANNGVEFTHGDIRNPEDLASVGSFDLLIECSAEPSVHAGYGSSPSYLINTNLTGTTHCLEAARAHGADIVFLSTSRVYPIKPLRDLPLDQDGSRFSLSKKETGVGWGRSGIAENFPLIGPRSLYGATKLASELLISEYLDMYGLRGITNRCGVLTGPWQMGKVDQGFVVLWAARHLYGGALSYMGFGGAGHQVRDILHIADLYRAIKLQLTRIGELSGQAFNLGGGLNTSVSLRELTQICELMSESKVDIQSDSATRPADIPWYISDHSLISDAIGWTPTIPVETILAEIFAWLRDHRQQLEPILK